MRILKIASCVVPCLVCCGGGGHDDDVDGAPPAVDSGQVEDASPPCLGSIAEPIDLQRVMPSWPKRPYDLRLPSNYDCTRPTPTVLVMHGGGGHKDMMPEITCPEGNLSSPACLDAVAEREGVALVYVNGTGNPILPNVRTFNAGGCQKPLSEECPWTCVSGYACEQAIDDDAFFDDLMADLEALYNLDSRRLFATGISNGAAVSHRLACTRADRIAAIAPIAGGNQFSAKSNCSPSRPVAVLSFHGTEDQGWPFAGGENENPNIEGAFIAVDHSNPSEVFAERSTIAEWAERNGCSAVAQETAVADIADDETTATRHDFLDCVDSGDVTSVVISGGGHTWPDGYSPLDLGRISRDLNANEEMVRFFLDHPIPPSP